MNKVIKKVISLLFILIIIAGCISKDDYEALEAENEQLKQEIEVLKAQISNIQEKKKEASIYSEEDALKYIKDYYEFYNAGMVYRNLKIRKMSYNKFAISLEESDKHTQEYSFSWNSVVKTLTINDNGKYIV